MASWISVGRRSGTHVASACSTSCARFAMYASNANVADTSVACTCSLVVRRSRRFAGLAAARTCASGDGGRIRAAMAMAKRSRRTCDAMRRCGDAARPNARPRVRRHIPCPAEESTERRPTSSTGDGGNREDEASARGENRGGSCGEGGERFRIGDVCRRGLIRWGSEGTRRSWMSSSNGFATPRDQRR